MPRLAPALQHLFSQINQMAPARNRSYDGWIGDRAHSARVSDHNPDNSGMVHAIDITDDDIGVENRDKFDATALLNTLLASPAAMRRVKYLIHNKKIYSGTNQKYPTGIGRNYNGPNAHYHHLHVSLKYGSSYEQDTSDWPLPGKPLFKGPLPLNWAMVKTLQGYLGVPTDGWFKWITSTIPDLGINTTKALQLRLRTTGAPLLQITGTMDKETIKAFQSRMNHLLVTAKQPGITIDGKWGQQTTNALRYVLVNKLPL